MPYGKWQWGLNLYKSVPFTQKHGREVLKLVSKLAFKNWDMNFCLEIIELKTGLTFRCGPFIFQPDFPLTLLNW